MNPRIIITLFLIYLIISYFIASREEQRKQSGLSSGLISWNEFVQDMLSKGEVRSIGFRSFYLLFRFSGRRSHSSHRRRNGLYQTSSSTGYSWTKSSFAPTTFDYSSTLFVEI